LAKVDVIIPAYNASKYLPFAIESVIAGTFADWRIILVDDGSTDDTAKVAARYANQLGPRFLYIFQENRGLPAARNTAIQHSSADLLALLDADDVWLPNRLSTSVRAFESPDVGLAYGLITQIDTEGKLLGTFRGNPKWAAGRIAPWIYMRKVELPCPTLTFRRSAVDEVGPFDETMRATEDRDLWFRIALRYEVAFIPEVIAYYRISPASMSTDPERMLRAQLQFIRKHFGAEGCGIRQRQIALARAYKQRGEALKLRNRRAAALASSLRALALYPLDPDNIRTAASLILTCLGLKR